MSAPTPEQVPGYWRYETSGILQPVVEKYLTGQPLTFAEIATMRAYLRQWIMAPVWRGDDALAALRASVEEIQTTLHIDKWLEDAMEEGHDPL